MGLTPEFLRACEIVPLRASPDAIEYLTLLGAVLVAISLGGVFNTVLLETRRRVRETATRAASAYTVLASRR